MSRHRFRADDGFSLVELLVAILIIGILVAIAVPLLIEQRAKAQDANANSATATAAKAATAFGAERGSFAALEAAELVKLEKSLAAARGLQVTGAEKTFEVGVESVAGTRYRIVRAADGELTRDCAPTGTGSCRGDADARGNRW